MGRIRSMTDIASALKAEIARLARKELRRETAALKKTVASHRSEIAELKRQVKELQKETRRSSKEPKSPETLSTDDASSAHRFSAKGFASLRQRLGLTAEEVGLLVGASGASVYNWERGKSHPREKHLAAIFSLRGLGKREATARVAQLRQAA